MGSSSVYRRCLPGGPWTWLLPGVVMLQNSAPTREQMITAALLYAGPDAVLTGAEACRRHGLRVDRSDGERLHLLIPHDDRIVSSGFVTIERTRRMPRATVRGRIPLAPVVRAVLDSVRRVRSSGPIAKLLIESVQHGGCTTRALRAELDRGSQRGTAIPRRVLGEIDNLRSVSELHGRRAASRLAVPPTHWNPVLHTEDGTYLARPDAWWDDVGLAWEIDSMEFHYARSDHAKTVARNSRYAQAGVAVVQTLPSRLIEDTAAVLGEVEAAYRAAAARPRPRVNLRS